MQHVPTRWIFLRGLTREAVHWGGFAEVFRQALPDAEVLMLDLPGNGQWHARPSPLSVAAMVAQCRAELAQRGVTGPHNLLAMSLGAMVATEWACSAPSEVQGCVLINTSFGNFSPFYQRLRPRNWISMVRGVLLASGPHEAESTVLQLTSNRAGAHADVVDGWVMARHLRPVSRANTVRQLAAAARYRAPRARPVDRMLLLGSARDGLVSQHCSEAIARAWNCPLAVHPWAGHDLPLDDPTWVAQQVAGWVGGRP
ncbi:alpha/beta fold hydrolase [Acidovorax sp. A1169]|uniref:alpha/beta fold hydrolase n=1 Tax=Acidovorax sp. A1169 TaxID=3059524 RepID=UPI0027379E77|nr:alpha/beta hydrolase [Acidovorax sp. A1169]MDP4078579.1 alpha/beta hydrolase [Acidovorax sp. A1169]